MNYTFLAITTLKTFLFAMIATHADLNICAAIQCMHANGDVGSHHISLAKHKSKGTLQVQANKSVALIKSWSEFAITGLQSIPQMPGAFRNSLLSNIQWQQVSVIQEAMQHAFIAFVQTLDALLLQALCVCLALIP